ncbi:MAG TPA: hypothetical protein VF491_22215 [Vicinamibacterales bacterium]
MIDVDAYCREIEAYLCRKNDGHLIRVTGPAFECVQGWAAQGVPLKVAEAGIDRYFERYYRKGPRRRPVRIEFCEADVLDAFDDWRRAVGVARVVPDSPGGPEVEEPPPASRPRRSLASQIEGAMARLTVLRGSDQAGSRFGAALDNAVRALDALRPEAARARGESRDELMTRLVAIDEELAASAVDALDDSQRLALEREADSELAPFRARMSDDAFVQSRRQALRRLARQSFGLPSF